MQEALNRTYFKSMMDKETILGFLQLNDATNNSVCVVLFDEGSVSLFVMSARKMCWSYDKSIKGFNSLLLSSLATRDPF